MQKIKSAKEFLKRCKKILRNLDKIEYQDFRVSRRIESRKRRSRKFQYGFFNSEVSV